MTVARLALQDFRSHAELVVTPARGFVVVTGRNGAGKTNLLEAVSLLSPGRGLRGAALGEMARIGGGGGFAVAARLANGTEVGTGTLPMAPERRQVRVNGAAAPVASLAERLAVLWLTPAMDRLFVEGASDRRRFLDRLVLAVAPGHAREVARYEAAMRERNRLLADDAPADAAWLDALEARMAEHGAAIAWARAAVVAALGERTGAGDGDFPRAGLALEGGEADALAARLAAGRVRDAAAGRTLVGPHRADLVVTDRVRDQPAARASTGEQKALLIGLVLAHAALVAERTGRAPLLLLDEIAAHLDPGRRAQLFARLAATGGQIWMTGTEEALFDAVPADATRLVLG